MKTNALGSDVANHSITLTVGLPVYNGEKYLKESIESILNQTYSKFEFIIIDDGSTDRSIDILHYYASADSRIRLISRENRNVAATLNEIAALAKGYWIARMDQDDIAMPNRFERQLAWLAHTGADICGSWVQHFGTTDNRIIKYRETDEAIKTELLFGSPLAHPSVIMKLDKVRPLPYNEVNWQAEDFDLWERAAKAGLQMTNVPEVLLNYRQHAAQISAVSLRKQLYLAQEIRKRYWLYYFNENNINKLWIDSVLKLRENEPNGFKINDVDSALMTLALRTRGEAQLVVIDHATRLYFRAAACGVSVSIRWLKLMRKCEIKIPRITFAKLFFVTLLKLNPEGAVFKILKCINVKLMKK